MGRRKLVDAEPGGTFLFDLDEDPGEEHEVSMKRRLDVAPLREELDAWRERVGIPDLRAAVGKPPPKPVDAAAQEQLRQRGDAEEIRARSTSAPDRASPRRTARRRWDRHRR